MSTLEDRLSAALTARGEQVTPADLAPGSPPATVVPLRSRVRPGVYVVTAAAAAAAVVLAVLLGGGTERRTIPPAPPGPSPTAPTAPTTAPTAAASPGDTTTEGILEESDPQVLPAEPDADLTGLLPAATTLTAGAGVVELGGQATLADGTVLALGGRVGQEEIGSDDGVRFTVTSGGVSRSLVLAQGSAPRVFTTPVTLGPEGPVLWVLGRSGGDEDSWTVVVDAGTRLIPLLPAYPEQPGVSLGAGGPDGVGSFASWVAADGSGLYTRVISSLGGAAAVRSTLYRWGVTGPAASPQLTLTSLGVACSDDPVDPTAYTRC